MRPLKKNFLSLLIAHCSLLSVTVFAAPDLPPRLFYSDADVSFTFPNHWDPEPSFPVGPLFSKITQDGSRALITCVFSDPIDPQHLTGDLPPETLRRAVTADLTSRAPNGKIMASSDRTLATRTAYEVTWENPEADGSYEYQSVYFYYQHRIYTLTLRARTEDFLWLVPDFQGWLSSVQLLSRADSGALLRPALGGIWVHQTGGVKIPIPENWLIGVADDQHLGVALAQDAQHTEFTATVDPEVAGATPLTTDEKDADRKLLTSAGFRITNESEEPFHGFPAFTLAYDGNRGDRFVKGQDLWVASPHGRWLFNIEGDGPLYNKLTDAYRDIMTSIQFL